MRFKEKTMKTKIEYVKVDMTNSEIVNFDHYEFFKRVETPTDKWDDANDYVRSISNSNHAIEEDDDFIVDARMTKEQWLDFAHILLESE